MSLFNRLFKRDGTQEGEPSSTAESQEPAQLGSPASPPDATVYIAAEPETAQAKSAQRAEPPALPKPAPGGATDSEANHLPPRAAAEPQDSKLMSEKKPADATVKMTTVPGQAAEKPEVVKVPPRVPTSTPTSRSTVMDPRSAAPRNANANANAALLKAAQAAADKRAGVKPGTESAKAAEPAPASPATPPARPAAGVAVQPAPRAVGAAVPPPSPPAPPIPSLAEPAKAEPAKPAEPQPSPREQFDAHAPRLLDNLLHLMLELRGSESAPADWASDSATSLRKLRALAAKLDDAALLETFDALIVLLERVDEDDLPRIDGSLREELLRAYAALRALLPAAGDLDYELGRRDPLLVEQILLQVNGVQLTTLRKLHAAGWTSSESFLRRSNDELVRATGIDAALAERILAAFRAFRSQFATLVPAPARAEELRRLAALLEELRMHQARFEQASARFGDDDLRERREQRVARARSVRGIYALLARLGELERIAALERAPFQAKISELTAFLSSAGRSASLIS